ncbi:MAG: 4-oxalocrotonate tautomerase [Chloroflexota bacterium]
MPIIQIEVLKGRSVEQKRELARRVTEVVTETMKCPADAVKIIIRDMEFENYASAGVLRVDQK